jgi:hypothetical protein
MSAVQAGSGKGSGQKPGGTAGGRPASGAKPSSGRGANGAGKTPPGRRPAPGAKTGSGGKPGGSKAAAAKTSGYRPGAKPPQRFSPSTMAFAAVAVVVVIIVGFVVYKVTQPSKSTGANGIQPSAVSAAQPAVLAAVTGVTSHTASSVGLPSAVSPPTGKPPGQPPLTIHGKPGAVSIGGEFCPFCAAERWSIIMAFSKFGTFSNLSETYSSPWDTDPSTPTFTFRGASYSSPYINLDAVEYDGNDTDGVDTHVAITSLTKQESGLWQKYDNSSGFPFLDIGNRALVTSPSYDPTVLSGLDQSDVASRLKNPNDPVTQAIVGTANYLTAGICATTGQKPASVCSAPVVAKAAKAMGLS